MADGAAGRGTALRAVAPRTRCLGREIDVRCGGRGGDRGVAFEAPLLDVFPVVEPSAHHPTVGDDRGRDDGDVLRVGLHLMAIGATGELCATFGGQLGIHLARVRGEEHQAEELFAAPERLPDFRDVLAAEFVDLVGLPQALAPGEIDILERQGFHDADDRPDRAVREGEFRVERIELQRVTTAAIPRERNPVHIGTGRIGLMTVRTFQLPAAEQDRGAEVQRVGETERIRIFAAHGPCREFRVAVGETPKRSGAALGRAFGAEHHGPGGDGRVEVGGRGF